MKMIKYTLSLLLFLYLQLTASTGETGYNFLKIDTGNRAIGMGGAYAGVADDIVCLYYNPAGISPIDRREIYFMYRQWVFKTDYGSFSYAQPIKDYVSIGFSVIYYQLPEVEEVDSLGFSTGDMLSGNNYAVFLTLARDIYADFSIGVNVKYLNQKIIDSENKSIVLDLGVQKEIYKTPSDGMVLGVAVQNWNFKTKVDYANPVPINIKTGVEYTAYKNFKLNFDINKPIEQGFRYNIGAEYIIWKFFLLRGGYKIGYDLESFSVGFGIDGQTFFSDKLMFKVDYSMTSLGLLAQSQNFSLTIKF